MRHLNIPKGHTLPLAGQPLSRVTIAEKPSETALLPSRIPFVKPKLLAAVGDRVRIGSPLFQDKKLADVKFVSPGAGIVKAIEYGRRRVIEKIVIALDEVEKTESHSPISEKKLNTIKKDDIKQRLLSAGAWPFLRALPFRDIAPPDDHPPHIFVALDTGDPMQPSPSVYLRDSLDLFRAGLKILKRFANGLSVVSARLEDVGTIKTFSGLITHTYKGQYPAGDPGVLLYHFKKIPAENTSWFIRGQDLLALASVVVKGRFRVERIMTIGGGAGETCHVKTRFGVPVSTLAKHPEEPVRYISGSALTGHRTPEDGFMGLYETALIRLPEKQEPELFTFARAGYHKPSFGRTFLSAVQPTADYPLDCDMHGEVRACVNCGTCTRVCPVDILPQYMYKAVLADAVEEYLAHGLLDCVTCGLCTYVCPSKIELNDTFKKTKAMQFKERNA